MRLVLCIVLFGCSAALGWLSSDRLRQRCKAIETLQSMLDALSIRLRYYQEPMTLAIEHTMQGLTGPIKDWLEGITKQMKSGCTALEALERAEKQTGQSSVFLECLGKEEKNVLKELFERMGSHREDQEAAFALCKQRMEQQRCCAWEEFQRKGKLYRMVGVLVGAAWVILFI